MYETIVFYQLTEKHKKYYLIEVKQDSRNNTTVTGIWGRLNAPGKKQIKYDGMANSWAVDRCVQEICDTREKHGYTLYKKVKQPAPETLTLTEAILANL